MTDQPLTPEEDAHLLKAMEAEVRKVADPGSHDHRLKALYFYRSADLRKTVTRVVGRDENGDPVWETVTTDGYGKVIE